MEKMKEITALLQRALKTFNESLSVITEAQESHNNNFLLAAQDSAIQRFEYSYDSFWKFLKRYMEYHHDIIDVNSPKKVFREAVRINICIPEEGEILLIMSDDRNITSHNYDIQQVRLILPNLQKYFNCMQTIVNRLDT